MAVMQTLWPPLALFCTPTLSLHHFLLNKVHSIFLVLFLQWSVSVGKNPFPFFQRFDGGCVMEFTVTLIGAPVPALLFSCEWEIISIPPPSISSSLSALGLFSHQTEFTPATLHPLLSHTNKHMHALFFSPLFFSVALSFLSLLISRNLTDLDSKESTSVLCLCLLETCLNSLDQLFPRPQGRPPQAPVVHHPQTRDGGDGVWLYSAVSWDGAAPGPGGAGEIYWETSQVCVHRCLTLVAFVCMQLFQQEETSEPHTVKPGLVIQHINTVFNVQRGI